jgi:EAL domain-containing protein (putative c-di-GMP-specific phosphodiesterase class I)
MTEALTTRAIPPPHVLVVDDDDAVRKALSRTMTSLGHRVTVATSGEEALRAVSAGTFDVILSDIQMPGLDGLQLLRRVREHDLDVPVVLMTGAPSVATAIEAMRHGASDYLPKPLKLDQLEKTIARAHALGRIARAKRDAMSERTSMHGAGDQAGLEASFDNAMRTLWVAYQPIVTRDGALYGHEALLRSREPALPHPGAVLDAAEKLGALDALGRRVRALSTLPVAAAPESGALFVNLHPRDIFDPGLTAPDSPLTGIASRVVLEVTERASIGKLENLRDRVAEIRAAGFRIAIDDLGAGYAGLTAFAVLEPDVVKLDMTLVRAVDGSRTKQRLVESITHACRDLGILVVAEGVETTSELDTVIDLGCDLVQGYLLAKPGPAFPPHTWPRS